MILSVIQTAVRPIRLADALLTQTLHLGLFDDVRDSTPPDLLQRDLGGRGVSPSSGNSTTNSSERWTPIRRENGGTLAR